MGLTDELIPNISPLLNAERSVYQAVYTRQKGLVVLCTV